MLLTRRRLVAAALLLPGCGGVAAPGPAAPRSTDSEWHRRIDPFPVSDSAGRVLHLAFLGGLNQPRPQLADLTGDGQLDLLIQDYTGHQMLLIREGETPDGLPKFVLREERFAGLDIGEWSRLVDLDGDGDLDLLAEWPYSYVRVFENRGSRGAAAFVARPDTLRDASGTAIFADRQNIPQIMDIDCDGKLDLFIGRITGHILHYEASSPNALTSPFELVTERWQDLEILTGQGSFHGANTMAFADYDEDGDLDLFWGDFFEAGLLLFRNTGSCAEPYIRNDPVRFPPDDPVVTSGYNAPAFGDLTGDGRLDLVVGVLGGAYDPNRTTIANLHYYTGAPGDRWERRTGQLLPMIDVGSESIPALVDLDGDGDLDLLLANKIEPADRRTSRVYWFENTGSARSPSFRLRGPLDIRGAYHYAPAVGDLDGDGRPDLLLGSFGAKLAWYRNEGAGRFALVDSALVEITRGSNTVPTLGDVDGDGDLDLMIGESSGVINFYRNEGSASEPRFELVSDQFDSIDVGRRSAPHLVDLDRDGDLDLVIGSDDRGLVLYRNQGTPRAPRWVHDPAAFRLDLPPVAAAAFGDLTGDGRLELIVGTAGGGAYYFEGRTRP